MYGRLCPHTRIVCWIVIDLADGLVGPQFAAKQPRGVAGHPGWPPETVQALAGLDVQVVFVPELVAAARAANANG
jgi:hypothetical protein